MLSQKSVLSVVVPDLLCLRVIGDANVRLTDDLWLQAMPSDEEPRDRTSRPFGQAISLFSQLPRTMNSRIVLSKCFIAQAIPRS
jgi:hypothetical protein